MTWVALFFKVYPMKIIKSIDLMKKITLQAKRAGRVIGFVPTMGCLHPGHLSLVKYARKRCDLLVVSIFVNPIQFGPKEDFRKYPRDMKRDKKLLSSLDVDVLFVPKAAELLPAGFVSYVEVPGLSKKLCGRSRPGHFRGVTTIVAKLINIVAPDIAFFGKKDFQQLVIIKKMVADLNMGIGIVGLPTVREPDGLAMSSRNIYLDSDERASATVLYRSLRLARKLVREGARDSRRVIKAKRQLITSQRPKVQIDYIEVCDPETLEEKTKIKGKTLIALAAYVGDARLIDNMFIRV